MKKYIALLLGTAVALLALSACGGGGSSSQTQSSSSQPQASSSQPAASLSQAGSQPVSSTTAGVDLNAIAQALAEAAHLGDTITVTATDLELLGGMDTSAIVDMVGLESTLSFENGGTVIVMQVADGTAGDTTTALGTYRDTMTGNADYEEYANARENTQKARIKAHGNYVVYAVSATGHEGGWDELDAAIDAAFAGVPLT